MDQRGRKSPDEKAITPFGSTEPDRLYPPARMGERERVEWNAIVERMGAAWFPRETQPILAALCHVKVELDDINAALAEFPPGIPERGDSLTRYLLLTKMRGASATQLAALATKLRLTQQSRKHRETAGVEASRRVGPTDRPWDDDGSEPLWLVDNAREAEERETEADKGNGADTEH